MTYEPGDVVLVEQTAVMSWLLPFLKPEAEKIFGRMQTGALVLKAQGSLYSVGPLLPHPPEAGEAAFALRIAGKDDRLWLKPMHVQPLFQRSIFETVDHMNPDQFHELLQFLSNWWRGVHHG